MQTSKSMQAVRLQERKEGEVGIDETRQVPRRISQETLSPTSMTQVEVALLTLRPRTTATRRESQRIYQQQMTWQSRSCNRSPEREKQN